MSTNTQQYNIVNGTAYNSETSIEVIETLERVHMSGKRIRVFYGDAATGLDWIEENDTIGFIGRSTGKVEIPLLIYSRRSTGGLSILDSCIVRIVETASNKELYRHKSYHQPKLTVKRHDCGEGIVLADDQTAIAYFPSVVQAERWAEFMRGNRHSK
jgi:hypothetical protein